MAVAIVTDSTSDLTPRIVEELDITVVPLNVHFGTETYKDGIDLTTEEFYRRLPASKVLPTTSAPSPGEFAEVYERLARQGKEVLAITISSKLSATYKAALDAKEMVGEGCRVEVVDSYLAISGLGLVVIAAAKAAKAGATMEEVKRVAFESMKKVDLRIAFDTLEYLQRGGRIGKAQAFLGSTLKLNPILSLKDGITVGVTRVRCRAKALEHLRDFVFSFPAIEELAIEDAMTPDEADMLAQELSAKFPRERVRWLKVSPVIGTHVGPRVIGVAVLPKS
jgi:DegV family protein with EDD domain